MLLEYPIAAPGLRLQSECQQGKGQVDRLPTVRRVYLSGLIGQPTDPDLKATRLLKDPWDAALARDQLGTILNLFEDPHVLVLDLAGVAYTPAALKELILPLAQRIRGGEHGTIRLVICTTDAGVSDFIRYMAQAHQLSLYVSHKPFDLPDGTPVGALTGTETNTLDTIDQLGGQVTASKLAVAVGIAPSAAVNRLVNLEREGYLIRRQRGRRQGDLYIEPLSTTTTQIVETPPITRSTRGTGSERTVWPSASADYGP